MADFYISPGTRAKYRPSSDAMNISMDFNASPNGGARGTEVIIPNNSSPSVRAAAEKYNQLVAGFANKYGITGYPVRGVRTRAENKRGVANTIHAEPFFNDDEAMQRAVQENPAEFAELYRSAFGGLDNARLIAPHGVGKDRGASSAFFGDETSYGELMANSLLGQAPQPTTSTQGAAPMMQQKEKPRGLLGSLGIQKMEEGAEGETGQRFYQRDSFKDTAAILAQGFGRMGIMGMEEIADSVAKQRTEAKAQNKTMEALMKMGTPQAQAAVEYINAGGDPVSALKMAFEKPGTDTTDFKNYQQLKVSNQDLTFEQYMKDKNRKPLQEKGAYRVGEEILGGVTFDPNTGEHFVLEDGLRVPIDISAATPVTDATFANAMPKYTAFEKLDTELRDDKTSMDRLQDYMKSVGNTNTGFRRLGDQMTTALKTLLSGVAGADWTSLSTEELNTAVAQGQLQGLLGRFRIETVGGGVMTEQDALRIISNLGGDVNALQNPEIVAAQIERLFRGKLSQFETKRKRHDAGVDAIYGGMGFEKVGDYDFDESVFDLRGTAVEVPPPIAGAQRTKNGVEFKVLDN